MSSPSSPIVVSGNLLICYSPPGVWALTTKTADTISREKQSPNQTSAETQLPEHKKPTRPVTTLNKKISACRLVNRLPIAPTEGSAGTEEENGAQQGKTDLLADQQQDASGKQHNNLPAVAAAATGLLGQLKAWAHDERQRQKTRRDRKAAKGAEQRRVVAALSLGDGVNREEFGGPVSPVSSGDEAAQAAMDAFEALVAAAEVSHLDEQPKRPSAHGRRSSRRRPTRSRSFKGGHNSDTDYASDVEPVVPSCEEVLQKVEEVGMDEFKSQVLKLAHTLRCNGWRRVALDRYKDISVERISGALTNLVSLFAFFYCLMFKTAEE